MKTVSQVKLKQLEEKHDALTEMYHRAYGRMMRYSTECPARRDAADSVIELHMRLMRVEEELLVTNEKMIEEAKKYEAMVKNLRGTRRDAVSQCGDGVRISVGD